MEVSENISQFNPIQSKNQESKSSNIQESKDIQSNSNTNINDQNNELKNDLNNNEASEKKIDSNSFTSQEPNKNYEVQIELDKNKKFISNNNNYSKSPSYRNNKNLNYHININKVVKPFFTSKHILLNKYSLKEVNDCIYKDYNQLANILPYYQNYYFQNKINNTYNNYNNYRNNNYNNNNNNDAILICLKYIEYTNFFFNNDITYKVQNLLFNIINGDRQILEQNKYNYLKNKLNEVYDKLIPFHIRYNYLKAFYDRNPDKSLYYLFKKDLDKISMSKYIEKKNLNYLYEIFEIVKQKMETKKDSIKIYINKLFNNLVNNNLYNINNNKNNGNYNYIENLNNNINDLDINNNNEYNTFNRRKNSYQYSSSQNNNISSYKNGNITNKSNYMNGNARKNNDMNNKEISQFTINNYNLDNSFKPSYSTRHYYYKNNHRIVNNNDRDYLRNKNNKNNSYYKGELVEIEDIHNNDNLESQNDINENNIENSANNDFDEDEYKNLKTKNNENNINYENNNINNLKIDDIRNNDFNINKNDEDNKIINSNIISNLNDKIKDANIHDKEKIINDQNSEHINNEQLGNDKNIQNDIIINNNEKVNRDENKINLVDKNENNNNEIIQTDDNNIEIKKEEKELLKKENENIDNNEQKNIINENNINEEEINFNNDLNDIDILYKINNSDENKNNSNDNNNQDINSDNILPKITFNDFNSSANTLNLKNNHSAKNINENHSKNLINNNNNKVNYNLQDLSNIINLNNCNTNNNISELYNTNNINNIINNILYYYNNININNNGILNINDLSQILKQLLLNQNSIMINLNKYILQFNQIKPNNNIISQNYINNNYYFLNMYNLGINSNLVNNLSNNIHNKNHNIYYNFNSLEQEKLVESEYIKIKKIEKDNPTKIKENLKLFEENILLPIYNEVNTNNNNSEIISLYSSVYSKYREIIISIIDKNNLEGTLVEPYGSIVNNFLTKNGDIDISIVPNNIRKDEFIKYLKEIEEEVVKEKKIAIESNSIYINSRYALLSIKDIDTNINIDITVHNLLPINNSKLIRLYSLFDQRFHILGLFLKHWVKINNINGAQKGFLSSYALLILIIHFLQNIVEPRILPILQEINKEEQEYKYLNGEKELITNLYFEEDFDQMKEYMNIVNSGNENNLSVTELLVQFFEYYAYKYNKNEHYLISIKNSEKKIDKDFKKFVFPIEDPFDVLHNPGKSMKLDTQQHNEFIFCMKKEINNILSGEYFKNNF